jgi:murein DD-endopeptidase MepM/ murein hydrolase activator NlpD
LLTAVVLGASATAAIAQPSLVHDVRPGDTLSGVAQEYGVSVAELARENNLSDPNLIRVGELLRIGTGAGGPSGSAFTMGPNQSAMPPRRPIQAPYFNQFDGSPWGPSNCGPTSLATALGAVGIRAQPMELRHLADRQMHNTNPANGTTWEALAYAAHQKDARTSGLYGKRNYRIWSVDNLKAELAAGHPVILLVRYRALPGHQTSRYWGDHYIAALGFDASGNLIYDDPAAPNGADRTMSPSQLQTAWSRTSVGLIRTAMAVER